jgi:O-antigen ligase
LGGYAGFAVLLLLLVAAPLHQGGNKPLALLGLELAALVLLFWAFKQPALGKNLSWQLGALLGLIFVVPLLQLIPLPASWWMELPGRETYGLALEQISGSGPLLGTRLPSLVPFETESGVLALLPPIAVFLAASALPAERLQIAVMVFLGIATAQAVLGLIQFGDGPGSLFYLGNPHMGGSATGTYVNRNHLAGLLEMALPVGLALLTATVGHGGGRYPRHQSHRRTLRQRLAGLGSLRANQAAFYGAAAVAILLGLVFTRSRTGVLLAMLGILLCMLAFSRRLGGNNVYGLVGTFTVIGLSLAVVIGLAPVLDRFALQDPLSDSRWEIYAGTVQAVGAFFPLGSGAGTFQEVFPRFHPPALVVNNTINQAHNDYLEWLMEGGLPVAALIVMLLGIYCRQWFRVWARGVWSTFRFIQVGAGVSLLLMFLHGLTDFNLHIPANAVFFAFLAAVFLHREPLGAEMQRSKPPVTRRRIPVERRPIPRTIPPENQVNPFDF